MGMRIGKGEMPVKRKNDKRNEVAALYCRVSTANQVERGDSLHVQEERLKAACAERGIPNYKLYIDEVSGKDTNRPHYLELMNDVEAGKITHVLCTKIDRISRNVKDTAILAEFLARHHVDFIPIDQPHFTDDPHGRFNRTLFSGVAQLERELTAQRVYTDMYHRAKEGKWNGGIVPHGYTTQGEAVKKLAASGIEYPVALARACEQCPKPKALYIDPDGAEDIKRIFAHYLDCNSIRGTGRHMDSIGSKPRKGRKWSMVSIRRILTNPVYIGMVEYGKRTTDPNTGKLEKQDDANKVLVIGKHDPIISNETFERVQYLRRCKEGKKTKAKKSYLLSGILKCGMCGSSMYGYTYKKRDGSDKYYMYYRCLNNVQSGTSVCGCHSIPMSLIDDAVVNELMSRSNDNTFLNDKEKFILLLKESSQSHNIEADLISIRSRKKRLLDRRDRFLNLLGDATITKDEYLAKRQEIDSELTALSSEETRLNEMVLDSKISLERLEKAFDQITSFAGDWDRLDDVGKAMRVRSIIRQVHVKKENSAEITISMEIYLDDVSKVNRTGRDSWRRLA